MSRQNNGHRVSESEGMVWDSISQKPNLNITRAVRSLTLSSYINQLFSHQVKQYMYEANNVEYLDCCNSSAHVGHCHPQVKILLVLSTQKTKQTFEANIRWWAKANSRWGS